MDIEIIRSDRKSVSIEIKPDLRVIMRVPLRMPKKEILRILDEKTPWIEKHLASMKERQDKEENKLPVLTKEEINNLARKALEYIPKRVAHFAPLVGVDYGRITIRNQKTRWGSCSSKGNLNFNCLLMLTPPEVIDYVVVHELCHRKEMNHSKAFWNEVCKVIPDYKSREKWLKQEGSAIIRRMGK